MPPFCVGRVCGHARFTSRCLATIPGHTLQQGAAVLPAQGRRSFGTTDGPFRYIKPRFVEKKKHWNELLILGDRRKLLETAQDVLNEPNTEFPLPFWEILAKRCIQSMHLFEPLELAIIARAFDSHDVKLRFDLDIYGAIAKQALAGNNCPGLAILVLSDVLPRRRGGFKVEELLKKLGGQATDVMWELSPAHAVRVLSALSSAGIKDPALSGRVARKVVSHLAMSNDFSLKDLSKAASSFASQGHRDLDLFNSIAERVAALVEETGAGASAAREVRDSFAVLGIDSVPERLLRAADAEPRERSEFGAEVEAASYSQQSKSKDAGSRASAL